MNRPARSARSAYLARRQHDRGECTVESFHERKSCALHGLFLLFFFWFPIAKFLSRNSLFSDCSASQALKRVYYFASRLTRADPPPLLFLFLISFVPSQPFMRLVFLDEGCRVRVLGAVPLLVARRQCKARGAQRPHWRGVCFETLRWSRGGRAAEHAQRPRRAPPASVGLALAGVGLSGACDQVSCSKL